MENGTFCLFAREIKAILRSVGEIIKSYYIIMKFRYLKFLFMFVLITGSLKVLSQEKNAVKESEGEILDSLSHRGLIFDPQKTAPDIALSPDQALGFLEKQISAGRWKDASNPFKGALERLVRDASEPPFDTVEHYLTTFPYDSIDIPWEKFYRWKPVSLRIPVIRDTLAAEQQPVLAEENVADAMITDTITVPGFVQIPEGAKDDARGIRDSVVLVISDTINRVTSLYPDFPFRYYSRPWQSDSIRSAVNTLIGFLHERDSSVIRFTGLNNDLTPVWLNSKSGATIRYWLKNEMNDSVTVWIGSEGRDVIGMYLEHGVTFRRPVTQRAHYGEAKIEKEDLDKTTLLGVKKIDIMTRYWKMRTESSLILSQAFLSNWVKGGESSISTSFDLTGYADYSNKNLKLNSNNFVRLKYGLIHTTENGLRKNLDLLETNSKLNHKAFGKFDFSAVMLFKTQIDKGFNYPNDSIPVSKFLNPAILTLGIGLDYKPDKNTSMNLSPFSYKGTFVPDTARIDQTAYGVAKDMRAKNEPGASFVFSNIFNPTKNISVTNRLQLFTNYINNPLNVDVDWEMIFVASLNWFTDVRINTHLIYDDDTRTPVFDKNNNPVTGADGTQKKTPRIQFKEMLGFSFVFRF